ncbi:MAG: ATP-binding protein [Chitinophagaceae bacterium]
MPYLHTLFPKFRLVINLLGPVILLNVSPLWAQVTDSANIENIFKVGSEKINTNPDSAAILFEKAKQLSKQSKYLHGLVMYYNYYAALDIATGQNQKALDHYQEAIETARSNGLTTDLGLTYMKKATLYQFMGEYAKAAENYLAAPALLKSNEERKMVIGLYRNVMSTLNNLQQQNQSLQNVLPALENGNINEKEIASILSEKITNETNFDFPDQTIVREISGSQAYVIFGGAKFKIDIHNTLLSGDKNAVFYGNYRSIRKLPDGTLSRIPDIPREGTILNQLNDSGKVYLVKDGRRHRIENPLVLQLFGGWDALCTIPENGLKQVPEDPEHVTMENVNSSFNIKKQYVALNDTLKNTLEQNRFLLNEVGKKLKEKNTAFQRRKTLLWTSVVGIFSLLFIGLLLGRNFRQKQKIQQQSIETMRTEEVLQRKMAIEKERSRIATDMHDDLGAGLSTIRFLSEKVKRNSFSEVTKNDTDKIVFNSNELMQKMNEIIWAMNEKNDTLEDLLFYTRSYAVEYCEENNLRCETLLPEAVPACFISGEVRRNVFLVIKESLHNIVKHAAAKQVDIQFSVDKNLVIIIKDDGQGMTLNNDHEGNGLRNMQKRVESIGGSFNVQNTNGVVVKMSIPLPV